MHELCCFLLLVPCETGGVFNHPFTGEASEASEAQRVSETLQSRRLSHGEPGHEERLQVVKILGKVVLTIANEVIGLTRRSMESQMISRLVLGHGKMSFRG